MNLKQAGIILLAFSLSLSACGLPGGSVPVETSTPQVITVVVTNTPPPPPTDTPQVIIVEVTSTPSLPTATVISPSPTVDSIPSEQAIEYLGQRITVRIEAASCTYLPNTSGTPTFCNDQPYPNHNFTLLIWGEDWAFMDGACLLVTGVVEEYKGKAQIEAESLDQVEDCP
ncbi:hypothetical protein ACFLYP_03365 [Chloroflexota bacterium]